MSEYEKTQTEISEVNSDLDVSRRQFLKASGGGIAIFFWLGDRTPAEAQRRTPPSGKDFNAYLSIGPEGKVTCFVGKIEMGQGIITSLAQMVAEELDVSLESVDMVMGDTQCCPYATGTWGSMSTPYLGEPILRAAGARAKAVLMELAAERLEVPVARLVAEHGVIYDRQKRQERVTYGRLAQGQAITHQVKLPVAKTKPDDLKIIGKPVLRRDAHAKVTGAAKYAGDIRIDGMVYARVRRPPAHGARLKQLDTSAVDKKDGCQVVRDGDLVAVLHKYPDQADKALALLNAEYEIPDARFNDKTVFDYFMKNAGDSRVSQEEGNLNTAKTLARHTVEQTYLNGYVAHAPIEPHAAVARFDGEKLTVWSSTQAPFLLQDQIAGALQMSRDKVRVIAPFLGGGFGGKIVNAQAIQAARIAKKAGHPVQLVWSRADEFFYDSFRPAAAVKIKCGMDSSGKMVLWDCAIYGMGSRGAEVFYAIPHHRTTTCNRLANGQNMHVLGTGAWRAPHANTNCFARESHIDSMATQAGMDPLEFRLKNLTDERMIRVLKAGAQKFGWTAAKAPSGRGYGIACGYDVDVPVALFVEVQINRRTGEITVKRVVCAQDLGLVINPAGAQIQVEGCITMGLGYCLTEEVGFEGGQVKDLAFQSYQLPRFSWVPKIETVLLETERTKPRGGGEPAIICMGGVIANAVHDALGVRLPQIPLTRQRIKQALAAKSKAAASAG